MTLRRAVRAVMLLLAIATPCLAAEEETTQQQQNEDWQFELMPYAWIPGTFGTIDVRGRTAHVDATMGDVLTLLWHGDAFTLGGYFLARYDPWNAFAFLDAYGGFENVHASQTIPTRFCTVTVSGTAKLKPVIMEVALGYELGRWSLPDRQRPISLGVYLGTRYTHLGTDLEASVGVVNGVQFNPNVSEVFNWASPMIGVRWEVPLLDRLSLDFRGDLGGLPASSRLNWGLVGDVRYWPDLSLFSAQPWLEAGYRVVGYEHEFGSNNALNLQLRGVLLGVGFAF
jgi:hypothetical protein